MFARDARGVFRPDGEPGYSDPSLEVNPASEGMDLEVGDPNKGDFNSDLAPESLDGDIKRSRVLCVVGDAIEVKKRCRSISAWLFRLGDMNPAGLVIFLGETYSTSFFLLGVLSSSASVKWWVLECLVGVRRRSDD